MNFIKRNIKRIATDAAGYALLVLALLSSPLPGPGGIPLALAGLGLLSIHNAWARRLRNYLLKNGGKLIQKLFPDHWLVQWLYDLAVIGLLIVVLILETHHDTIWEISLGIILFCLAAILGLLNRRRLQKFRGKA